MYFDSPFTYCEVTETYVLLDQTYEECREDARCNRCPYRRFFTGHDFSNAESEALVEPPSSVELLARVA